ncbi:4Fe-4S dicluster domain-containing protein [Eggerthellaceae bacterium zg-887]|uniref:4Fe-4S dicluster domain-containing protein n=1 Tax=Xiamenia xianingshaonis TaxID=2682776 RepID=UPI00140C74B0|nr:4Fe-4S dicluster domain-containing protein [Xiamenia xianingshaonis]NHM15399.1 4Fe-4S dicluster domain-containing protein [Xiamenia xianingshaonis]
MTQYAIVTDLDRCVGCLACNVGCKVVNDVPIGNYWNKILRIGPTLKADGSGQYPDVEMYFLNVQCQHCANPNCVEVCPTAASFKDKDGTVQIDAEKCIGCQSCMSACPYGVRYLNEDSGVVEKCTLCQERTKEEGVLPQCVSQCCGMARWYGDVDKGIENFQGPRGQKLGDFLNEFKDDQIYRLPDSGNEPQLMYIMREMEWQGVDDLSMTTNHVRNNE